MFDFLKKINFSDLFAQIGHALTMGVGAGIATGVIDPHAQLALNGASDVVNNATLAVNGTIQNIHSMGLLGTFMAVIGLINSINHNTTNTNL